MLSSLVTGSIFILSTLVMAVPRPVLWLNNFCCALFCGVTSIDVGGIQQENHSIRHGEGHLHVRSMYRSFSLVWHLCGCISYQF